MNKSSLFENAIQEGGVRAQARETEKKNMAIQVQLSSTHALEASWHLSEDICPGEKEEGVIPQLTYPTGGSGPWRLSAPLQDVHKEGVVPASAPPAASKRLQGRRPRGRTESSPMFTKQGRPSWNRLLQLWRQEGVVPRGFWRVHMGDQYSECPNNFSNGLCILCVR